MLLANDVLEETNINANFFKGLLKLVIRVVGNIPHKNKYQFYPFVSGLI